MKNNNENERGIKDRTKAEPKKLGEEKRGEKELRKGLPLCDFKNIKRSEGCCARTTR
jgi:hypothetical protein